MGPALAGRMLLALLAVAVLSAPGSSSTSTNTTTCEYTLLTPCELHVDTSEEVHLLIQDRMSDDVPITFCHDAWPVCVDACGTDFTLEGGPGTFRIGGGPDHVFTDCYGTIGNATLTT